MKNIKIEIPKGYEIDKDKSTFENIVFKEINVLPSSWEDLRYINGYYSNFSSLIMKKCLEGKINKEHKNTFKTEEQAEASIALAQLSQLRDVYRQGWEPDWEADNDKYFIEFVFDSLSIAVLSHTNHFLSFQDRKTARLFLKNFRDLIEKAKPLMS
tara:strand:- start:592 stop:1059 length:468 start_codon:yes stop_codon:yes gene_type:complete